MNKKSMLLAAACLVAASCVQQGPGRDQSCAVIDIPVGCDNGNPSAPQITINRQGVVVTPPNACAFKGATATFSLKPVAMNEPTNAIIIPKYGAPSWLVGTNYPDKDKILITIPASAAEGNYDYSVVYSDGFCIDPRIVVTDGPH